METATRQETQAIDPVCGMTVNKQSAAGTSVRDGQTYYFCSTGCKTKFDTETPEAAGVQSQHGCCAAPAAEAVASQEHGCCGGSNAIVQLNASGAQPRSLHQIGGTRSSTTEAGAHKAHDRVATHTAPRNHRSRHIAR
jgi:YHS domain-containing protein